MCTFISPARRIKCASIPAKTMNSAARASNSTINTKRARAVRKVERIYGDAVASPAGARVEALKAEGLGRGCIKHLPNIDIHLVEYHFEFVDKRYVDAAIHVLDDLRRFGNTAGAHFVNGRKARRVQRVCQCERTIIISTNNLGDGAHTVKGIPRVLALAGVSGQRVTESS
jgi:hypothetical protein